ncbi:MAG: hypothetical protein IT572_02075 [Deltaproteobacteria bacterium]|nr:hypothetical protein [Deltaproteobacteria bacterium]
MTQAIRRRLLPWLSALLLAFPGAVGASEEAVPESAPTERRSFWRDHFQYSVELRQETAFRIASPRNFSKIRQFVKAETKFTFNDRLKLKLGGRGWYDAVYDVTDQYPPDVRDSLRKELTIRDAYLDITAPRVNIRIGNQQIVWGEALGQFFADVVTPKDLREFFLPSFEDVRIPIWALDLQYNFLPGWTLEAVLSPDMSVDKFAPPGADFAFFIPPPPPGVNQVLLPDDKPQTDFKHWNGGVRFSYLVKGWDLAWFYYTSPDHVPALFKTVGVDAAGTPTVTLDPKHKRVHHLAATFNKSIGDSAVLRGEFVYTIGRFFNAQTIALDNGVVRRDQFRYVVGFDYSLGEFDMNAEFQQQAIFGKTANVADDIVDTWIFLRFEHEFLDAKLVPELIFIVGIPEGDTQVSPRLHYHVTPGVTLTWGADIFSGPQDTLYGEFGHSDRIFMNTSWKF